MAGLQKNKKSPYQTKSLINIKPLISYEQIFLFCKGYDSHNLAGNVGKWNYVSF